MRPLPLAQLEAVREARQGRWAELLRTCPPVLLSKASREPLIPGSEITRPHAHGPVDPSA